MRDTITAAVGRAAGFSGVRPARLRTAGLSLLLAGLALALPSAARATTITYRDGDDAWIAALDGSDTRRVTDDGTAAQPYDFPSADDRGDVVAIRRVNDRSRAIVWQGADGSTVTNTLPWLTSLLPNLGPTGARLDRNGKRLLYTYYDGGGPGYPPTPHLAIAFPTEPGSPTEPLFRKTYVTAATWFGDRIVFSDTEAIWAETDPGKYSRWLVSRDNDLVDAEVSATVRRGLVQHAEGTIEVLELDGHAPPAANVLRGCTITPQGDDRYAGRARIALSADGTWLAWSDQQGVHVARVPAIDDDKPCVLAGARIVSATGGEPAFSEGPVRTSTTPPSGGTPPGGSTPPGGTPQTPSPKATVSFVGTQKLGTALKSGLRAALTGRAGAKVTVRLQYAKRTIARTEVKLGREGTARATLRIAGASRKRIAKLRRAKLTLVAGTARAIATLSR